MPLAVFKPLELRWMRRCIVRFAGAMSRDPAFALFVDDCSSSVRKAAQFSPQLHKKHVSAALTLLEDDNTVPFIARYRREQTGDLDVSDLYELQRRWDSFQSMVKVKASRLAALDAGGRLTDEIRAAFDECTSKEELDELYASYKESKTAKSEVIASFHLEELAHDIVTGKSKHAIISSDAARIASTTKYSVAEALVYHCTNHLYTDAEVKNTAKDEFSRFPTMVNTTLTPAYKALQKRLADGTAHTNGNHNGSGGKSGKDSAAEGSSPAHEGELHKYQNYHSVHKKITQLAAHQLLATRRAKEAGVIAVSLSPDDAAKQHILRFIQRKYQCIPSTQHEGDPSAILKLTAPGSRMHRLDVMALAAKEAVAKLGAASTKKQWRDAISAAEVTAAEVFSTSLRPLLLTAPLRLVTDKLRAGSSSSGSGSAAPTVVCAVDPGFAHGHKWVILSQGAAEQTKLSGGAVVRAAGEDTDILCFGKIFEKRGNNSNISITVPSGKGGDGATGTSWGPSPVMLSTPAQLGQLLEHYGVEVVAIGNGTATREAQQFVAQALQVHRVAVSTEANVKASSGKRKHRDEDTAESDITKSSTPSSTSNQKCLGYVVVSEAGASVYSASERARQEFPHLDIAYLGAVSIGRRLVDPLSELVKVQPSSLGVGMYQHDLSDKGISERLRNVVEDCVNTVGVDVNSASSDLLRFVSGLNEANVKEILAYRTGSSDDNSANKSDSKPEKKTKKGSSGSGGSGGGRINSLQELLGIKGIGPKTFRNCAGFMRVYNGSEPLDVTNIHPEDYGVARAMLRLFSEHRGAAEGVPVTKKARVVDLTGEGDGQKGSDNLGSGVPNWAAYAKPAGDGGEDQTATQARSTSNSKDAALLATKTASELQQIWQWLLEAGLVPASAADSKRAVQGPFMSQPRILREVGADFHVKLEVGSIVHGVVRNVTNFGAFVDLGGAEIIGKGGASCDGLLHSSKYLTFDQRRGQGVTKEPSKQIYVGREVKVKILSIGEPEQSKGGGKGGHHEKRRISLDLMELL